MRRTTMALNELLVDRVRDIANREERTFQDVANELLRLGLEVRKTRTDAEPLPAFETGGARLDVADRDALYDLMEGE